MEDNYYDKLGYLLKDALVSDDDPFEKARQPRGRYRTIGGRLERRPPPKIDKTIKRVEVPPELVEDFAILNVLPGVPLEDCKRAWKHLIKKHHPDLTHNYLKKNSEEFQNNIIMRVNNSYKKIETWFTTGKILTDKDLNS